MLKETQDKANALSRTIADLEKHFEYIEKDPFNAQQSFIKICFSTRSGNDQVSLISDYLPMQTKDFIQLYLFKIKAKINELKQEYDNL